MGREVVEVVESMLSRTQEVLCLLVLQRACVDGDAEWKDWPASLVLLALYVRAQISSKGQLTRPSAQSIMASRGSSARYMAVVHHHIGRPIKIAMAQNETIT
jgi:hypothetical protein